LNKRTLSIFALAIGLCLFIGFTIFRGKSPEAQVKKAIEVAAEMVTKEGRDSPIAAAARAGRVLKLLTDDAEIYPGHGEDGATGRDDVQKGLMYAFTNTDFIRVKIVGQEVTIDKPNQATVLMTAQAKAGNITDTGGDYGEFIVKLRREKGDWLIQRVDFQE